jgi:protein N-terminal asparagine amidohydrolase
MATTLVEACPLDDALDPGGVIDAVNRQDEATVAKAVSALDPLLQTETKYADFASLSFQSPSNETNDQSQKKDCKDFLIGSPATTEALTCVCRWTTTNVRLPPPLDEHGHQEHFLSLPDNINAVADTKSYERPSSSNEETKALSNRLRLAALNKYLASIPNLSQHSLFCSSGDNTNDNLHRRITATNSGRIINVLQGEIAHCTPSQADILVSDDATTCHIVCLRSICRNSLEEKEAVLATMTHVDGTGYQSCLRDAVMEHIKYHGKKEYEGLNDRDGLRVIEISIHIMGGFNDCDGSSIEIIDEILQVFSRLAQELDDYPPYAAEKYWERRSRISLKLETCVVCEANDDGTGAPIGRGLGLNVFSGEVFLAELEEENSPTKSVNAAEMELIALDGDLHLLNSNHYHMLAEGPEVILRSVRLWASLLYPSNNPTGNQTLNVIYRPDQDCLSIEPFTFGPHPYAKFLCSLDNASLLQITSTSPSVEKANFVSKVRAVLSFMDQTSSSSIFEVENGKYKHIEYRRVGLNGWVRSK